MFNKINKYIMATIDMHNIRTPLSASPRATNNNKVIHKPMTVCSDEVKYLLIFIYSFKHCDMKRKMFALSALPVKNTVLAMVIANYEHYTA